MTLTCYHCGEPVPNLPTLFLDIGGHRQPMCCRGCLAVADYIQGSGLGDYYRLRSNTHTPPPGDSPSEDYGLYDNESVLISFSKRDGDLWESHLCISGMHCAACAWLIESRLRCMPGVEQVSVHLQNAVATLCWNPAKTRISALMTAIHNLGYQALPDSPSNRANQLQAELDGMLRRLGLAGIGMMQVGMVAIGLYAGDFQGIDTATRDLLRYFSLAVATPVLLYAAQPFFRGAWRSLKAGQPGMDVPVSLALTAAYCTSLLATLRGDAHVYFDTISMFTFLLLLSRYLQARIRQSRSGPLAIVPLAARKISAPGDSQSQWYPLTELRAGDLITVLPGETIPADGIIRRGESSIETSAFNGEFHPRHVAVGSDVLAGSGNIDASLDIEVRATAAESSLGQMERLLEQAQSSKPRFAQLADRLASRFVIGVLLLSFGSYLYWLGKRPDQAFIIALSVLVVSCPCALSLATPATFTAAVSALRRKGILLRSALTLEALQRVDQVIFDKTGTLTKGKPQIQQTQWFSNLPQEQALAIAAALEHYSRHPIAQAFQLDHSAPLNIGEVNVRAGEGIEGTIDGTRYRIGQAAFCAALCPLPDTTPTSNTDVWLVSERGAVARFLLDDAIREEAPALLKQLRRHHCEIAILSGDREAAVARVAAALGIDTFLSRCSAADKLDYIHRRQSEGHRVMMIGDGINDAPVIAAADISVAMSRASELTRNQADVVLMQDTLADITPLLATAAHSRVLLRENIAWALAYNLLALPMAAAGLVPPWLAAVGMSLSSLVVVLNAQRIDVGVSPRVQSTVLTRPDAQAGGVHG